jgi:hypothetical protein
MSCDMSDEHKSLRKSVANLYHKAKDELRRAVIYSILPSVRIPTEKNCLKSIQLDLELDIGKSILCYLQSGNFDQSVNNYTLKDRE